MKSLYTYIFAPVVSLLCFVSFPDLNAQSNATIENIDFYAEGQNLVIKYDIVKAREGELFEIWVKITTASGKTIIPKTMTGDAGKAVSGGPNKRIVWNLQADNATINEEFSVEVFAKSDAVKESVQKAEKVKKEGISPGAAMALSAVLPGLGRTVAKGGGAQWVWGLVGYGCVAGSIVMNNNAFNAYEDYKVSPDPETRDDNFKNAEDYDLYSKVFIGAAATIWVIDIIATGVTAGKLRKNQNKSGLSMHYSYDPYSRKPLIGFSYRF